MKNKFESRIEQLITIPSLPYLIAALGGIVFLMQTWNFALHLPSVIDEGMYLHKGYLFASGRYQPFQDYGPWTDHMPLAFLFPGYAQLLFGLGLRTGRIYALGLTLLFIIGLWIVSNRMGAKWWAAFAVWVFALNPIIAQMYSAAVSQVLAAALLIWMLVFALGKDRAFWQILVGTSLASILFLSRINLLPALVFLVAYIFWQHGKRTGYYAATTSGLIVLAAHIFYWPEILKIWAEVIPTSIAPFLETWQMPLEGVKSFEPDYTVASRFVSFFSAIRFHFVAVMGFILSLLAWKSIRQNGEADRFRDFVFLMALFVALFSAHGFASLVVAYCVSCFPNYLAFFSTIGVLLLIIISPHLFDKKSPIKPRIAFTVIASISLGIMYAAKGALVPRFVLITTVLIRRIPFLAQRYGRLIGVVLIVMSFVIVMAIVVLLAKWIQKKYAVRWPQLGYNLGSLLLVTFTFLGFVLSPTFVFGEGHRDDFCDQDVIASFEEIGAYLSGQIPEGATIYWRVSTPLPLLYIPAVELFPSQLSGAYSFRFGGSPEILERYGFWNDELGQEWVAEADYILIEQPGDGLPAGVDPGDYREIGRSPANLNCKADASILILKKNK